MRKQSEYTRRLCSPYKASNDSASPFCARSIASCSDTPFARIFLAIVNFYVPVLLPPFDAVQSSSCCLAELRRVLRALSPGGKLVFSCPCRMRFRQKRHSSFSFESKDSRSYSGL